jgi:hypothetical protein
VQEQGEGTDERESLLAPASILCSPRRTKLKISRERRRATETTGFLSRQRQQFSARLCRCIPPSRESQWVSCRLIYRLSNRPSKAVLSGYHLDKLASICLSQTTPTGGQASAVFPESPTQASVSTTSLKLSSGNWHIYLGDCANQPVDSGTMLTVTGVVPPSITSFNPTSASSGATITITGSGLQGSTQVMIGGVRASLREVNNQAIKVIVPETAKSGSISVVTPGERW